MTTHLNGGWPELPPVPPPIEDLPSNPSPTQVTRALGSTLLMFGQLWPRVVQALEYLKRGQERIERGDLPPMRPSLASSTDLAKAVGHDVAQAFEREQRNPSTPPPNGATVGELVRERVEHEILKLKAATLQKEKDERDALEKQQRDFALEKRRAKLKVAAASVVGVIATAVALVEHFAK